MGAGKPSGAANAGERGTALAFTLVILVIAAGSALLLLTRPTPAQITILPPQPTASPPPTFTPAPLTVYITGAVVQPNQVYTLPPGSRVQDALRAAGGTTSSADLARINLADTLRDGDQVHVPAVGEVLATGNGLPTPSGGVLIPINSATQAELESLPGIGPALAARILAYRAANGRIANLEALDEIEGIGPVLLEQLRPLITFD
jgi:competence protein ComEA